ncbi:MAG: PIG-L deacetylase family protein [Gammaproteobacteria bacterium]
MNKVLVVAPHPDDETLGCGGTILKHANQGDEIHWLVLTTVKNSTLFDESYQTNRDAELEKVRKFYNFTSFRQLDFKTAELDSYAKKDLIDAVKKEVIEVNPCLIYLPYSEDPHSDHRIAFEILEAVCKKFRLKKLKSVRAYETLSETNHDLNRRPFKPNLWIDITDFLNKKIKAMEIYNSEFGSHPFPRSKKSIEALAILRGSESNNTYAESFLILKEYN